MTARGVSSLHNVSSGDMDERPQPEQDDSTAFVNTRPTVRSPFLRLHAPHYRFKTFKSRGAVLVLLWSFCTLFLFHFLISEYNYKAPLKVTKDINPLVVFTMCILLYPVLGWLADALFGRYRVIKWSLRVLWVLLICSSMSIALLKFYYHDHEEPKKLKKAFTIIFYIPVSLGLGGFQANIVQFGTDQLADASSSEINSFIRWYSWIWFLSSALSGLLQWCVCPKYEVYGYLLLPTLFTVVITLDHLFNHWLDKEPATVNPFALIFKVLWYAIKNKYPRQRSAFTYGEEKPYSRIDLAKNRYGGPFTTEQVEDVKSFFRIVNVMIPAAIFTSMFVLVFPAFSIVTGRLHGGRYIPIKKKGCEYPDVLMCFQRTAVYFSGHIFMVIALPVYEIVLYPLFKRYFRVPILWQLSIGLVLLFLSLILCTILEFVAVHEGSIGDVSVECALNSTNSQDSILPLDYKWMMFPYALVAVAQFPILTSVFEFLCAQSPYSMKGFLFGLAYGTVGFFVIIGYSISKPIQDHVIVRWMSYSYGCMAWYLVLNLAILLVTLLLFFGAYKCYKSRLRDSNEQTFSVNY